MTDQDGDDPRHLTRDRLHEYLRSDVRAVVPVNGDPPVSLVVDGPRASLAVEAPWDGVTIPDLTPYEHLACDVVFRDGSNRARLEVRGACLLDDAYPLLTALADRLQLAKQTFGDAVIGVLDGFHELFAKAGRLSGEQEIGLYGELLALERLVERIGPAVAILAWLGPEAAEHDFALPLGDVEVKTTVGERRVHWIGGLGQLQPSPDRDLYLLSLQLTSAGAGPGRTLAELVTDVRVKLGSYASRADEELRRVGWRDETADHGLRRWRLRSSAVCVHVSQLPALTVAVLAAAGVDVARIDDVRYRIDVTGLPEASISTDEFAPDGSS